MSISHLLLSVHIVAFLTGLPGSILALHTFLRQVRREPTPVDVLLLNLAISDLIFLVILPFKMKEAADDLTCSLPYFLSPITSFLFSLTIYASTLFLTAVSVDRYLGVAFPLRYYVARRPRYAAMASIFLWVLSSLNLSIVYAIECLGWIKGTGDGGDGHASGNTTPIPLPAQTLTCCLNVNADQLGILLPVRLEVFVLLYCVPFLICCFCCVNVILIWSRLPSASRRRRLRAIGLAIGTLLVFAVCFGPYNVSHAVAVVRQDGTGWREVALLASAFHACLDPVIFYFSSAAFRSSLNNCFKRWLKSS